MVTKSVDAFIPSRNGFHFQNEFEGPVIRIEVPRFGDIPIGNAAGGLCGGMVFAVADLFAHKLAPPTDTQAPANGTPLFEYLSRRLVDSFDVPTGVLKYYQWMCLPNETGFLGHPKSIIWHTANEWPLVQKDLDSGQLCPLGLIKVDSLNPMRIGDNHQVLAYAYELDEGNGDLEVRVYDPNCPDEDDVTLSLNISGSGQNAKIDYSADARARGFFRSRYQPTRPSEGFGIGSWST